MKVIKKVSFDEVLTAFHEEHDAEKGSNSWALNVLNHANEQLEGEWSLVELSLEEALNIILPVHFHWEDEGKFELIPKEGMTLKAAVQRLKNIDNYKSLNPKCWDTISYLIDKNDSSPVFLSTEPIKEEGVYNDIKNYEGHLIHMDGLHRMLAWGMSGRLTPERYLFNGKMQVYLAGDIKS